MKKINKKNIYKIEFQLASPLAIGSGRNQDTDKDIVVNKLGKPFIPGSALAGITRSFLNGLNQKKYFGNVEIARNSQSAPTASESRISFTDAELMDEDFTISVRDSVALDACKVAIKGAKFDMEVLEPGASFRFFKEQNVYEGDDEEIATVLLNAWKNGEALIGAKTMRGYGQISNVEIQKKCFDLSKKEDVETYYDFDMFRADIKWDSWCLHSEETSKKLTIKLEQTGGISIRKYTTEVGSENEVMPDFEQLTIQNIKDKNEIKEVPVIPGTSWAGAFLHHLIKLDSDVNWKELFGEVDIKDNRKKKSRIRFSESEISNCTDIVMTRNAIDRFSGGTASGALFTEKTYYGGTTELVISVKDNLSSQQINALAAAIADLHYGYLSVGGLTSIGRGLFRITALNENKISEDTDVYALARECMNEWSLSYVFAAFTDELIIGEWKQNMSFIDAKKDRLLELRIFNEEMEKKYYRTSISREFCERIIDRNNEDQTEFYEETQILDIDTLRSKELNQETGDVLATGGGRYHLPVEMTENVSIVTRQYIRKNEHSGQAEVYDWRLVKFAEAEELKNGKIC